MKRIEQILELFLFNSRWLLVPFYLGMIGAIVLLLIKFVKAFISLAPLVFYGEGDQAIIGILTLVDITLVANLLIIMIFAGYENFVSMMHTGNSADRPGWMGSVSFSDLKIKLLASIVAISAIDLLKYFFNVKQVTAHELTWMLAIHITLVFSGLMLVLMDRFSSAKH
ncbi:MAG: TIGR00645 family protein [Methylophilaceae bacterium]|nr:TIGR00645 family protein [Methylophilaceae bacterium]